MEKKLVSIWDSSKKLLAETLSKDVFDRWIAVIHPIELTDEKLVLTVANDFYQDWLIDHYVPLIKDAVNSVQDHALTIEIQVCKKSAAKALPVQHPAEEALEAPSSPTPAPKKRKVRKEATGLNPRYTFDTFIVGQSNNFAHAAAMAVAQSPARAYNPLFMYGGVGLGKTHLMQAIGNYAVEHLNANVCFISSEAFINEYIEALQHKALVQFRKKYRHCDLLLIDDIQFLGGKNAMQEEFFHTFNALFDNHKQIVFTCDRPAAEIPGLEQRLVSRFEWGLVTELELPDIETRIAILRNKEEQLNVSVTPDNLYFIAENIRSNIRRLEGALIRVASYASLTGQELQREDLERLLRDTIDQEHQTTILAMETIQRSVAEYYDIRFSDIIGKRKPTSIVVPRQIAMYLCRNMTDHSLPSIGEAFGRNHATVLHACRVLEKRIQDEPSIRHTISILSQRLSSAQRK